MQNFTKFVFVGSIAAAVLAGGLTGCATWGKGDGERTTGRVIDDKQITAQVKDQLSNEPVYKFEDVQVNTFNGLVQLSGFVSTQDQKQRAAQVASNVPGVARVVNNITLKPETPMPTGRTDQGTPAQQQQQLQNQPDQNATDQNQ